MLESILDTSKTIVCACAHLWIFGFVKTVDVFEEALANGLDTWGATNEFLAIGDQPNTQDTKAKGYNSN